MSDFEDNLRSATPINYSKLKSQSTISGSNTNKALLNRYGQKLEDGLPVATPGLRSTFGTSYEA